MFNVFLFQSALTAANSATTAQTATSAQVARQGTILTNTCASMNVIANGGNMKAASSFTSTLNGDTADGIATDLVKDILDIVPISFCT